MGKILAIRGGAIGDFILTLPALHLLRTGLDAERIEILGYESIAQLAVEFGFADRVRSIEHGKLAPFFNPRADLDPGLCSYFQEFSLIVSYLYDPDGYFHGNLERAGAKTVIQASHRVNELSSDPAAAQLAKPLESLALFLDQPHISLNLRSSAGTPPEDGLIALHPGSGSPKKNWGYENWAETARIIHEQYAKARFLIVSGEAEAETITDFLRLLRSREIPFEHLENASLPDLARRLAGCQAFLGHDSGVSHLAGAAGVPSVLIFGPTDPAIWAPQNPCVRVLRDDSRMPSAITPKQVLEAFQI